MRVFVFRGFESQVIESGSDYKQPAAFALGVATVEIGDNGEQVLGVQYTRRNYAENVGTAAVLAQVIGERETGLLTGQHILNREQIGDALALLAPFHDTPGHKNIDTLRRLARGCSAVNRPEFENLRLPVLGVVREWSDFPVSVADVYLRLYALSERHRQPRTVNLDRAFSILPNVVHSEAFGMHTPGHWGALEEDMVIAGLSRGVRVLDKFPRMLDHIVPSGVRVADPSRVRLGAHLAEGTTVMHEGFVNFNAGTLGASMVEGRISAGVIVGDGTDIGGGVSIMGTLSGGGKEMVSIGGNCLLEAESGVGISLGNDCRVEAGLYVKATTPVKLPDGNVIKAIKLSGQNDMLFRRNSQTGVVEVVPNKGTTWIGLNEALHKN
jgi:2,3,4,5-tetrahydropyridine-2-carboxylate N-succinyltransferase